MSDIENLAGDTRPIGVFDSGLGGLTVARAIATALPHESVYYFGDTKRCPYGTRTEDEVRSLVETVLRHKAQGQSVRACLQGLSGGDHSLMLRYQNKYRAVVKSRPDYVRGIVTRLNDQGVACDTPTVNHRAHTDVAAACDSLNQEARRSGEPELVRACETLVRCLRDRREPEMELKNAVEALIGPIKAFVACPKSERIENLDAFCGEMIEKVGALETKIPVSSNRIE